MLHAHIASFRLRLVALFCFLTAFSGCISIKITTDNDDFEPGPVSPIEYIDRSGVSQGLGIPVAEDMDGRERTVVWAPVNLGYSESYPYGILYQWGRKDGQGYGQPNGNDEAGVPVVVKCTAAAGTSVLQNPEAGTFYSFSSQNTFDWYSGSTDAQFSCEWNGIRSRAFIGNPCPYGWRLPSQAELAGLVAARSSWTSKDNQYGYYFKGKNPDLSDDESVFLPACGFRSGSNGVSELRGGYGAYWSSSLLSINAVRLLFTHVSSSMGSGIRSDGASVRCVADRK